jgi:uracil-DNA glycosylase family protein
VMATWTAAPFVPASGGLRGLAVASQRCEGCPLYQAATQTVFGEGPASARIVLVGEQPGDQEDRQGEPFVGPAGRMLWRCVEEAGLDRSGLYVTNAVKHFKHEDRGKRRLHKKPNADEIDACHPWLEAELATVRARVVVGLGATAGRALLGRSVGIAASRGEVFDAGGHHVVLTFHPSAILRATDEARAIRHDLVADLKAAGELAGRDTTKGRRPGAPSEA